MYNWSSDIHKLTSIAQRSGPGQSVEADLDQYVFCIKPRFYRACPMNMHLK